MAQIFRPSSNTLARLSIVGGVVLLVCLGWAGDTFYKSDYVTGVGVAPDQPVPFSHKHHVAGVGIDCRYCHTSVETQAFAGIPATETCMSCHSQIWADSPMLEPVRASFRTNQSIVWTKVHDLPDYVYFNHSIHVNKGVGCSTCHGRVDQMPAVYKEQTLRMSWCLECHRQPERFVRPKDQIFNMEWKAPADQLQLGARLVTEYKIHSLTDCWTCHR
jgi:hypothetical protein